jgi:hypothetical protein
MAGSPRSPAGALLAVLLASALLSPATPDFVYPDFNATLGLTLNGAAATTACEVGIDLLKETGFHDWNDTADDFGETMGDADAFEDTVYDQQGEASNMQTTRHVGTNVQDSYSDSIKDKLSSFGHRDLFDESKTTRCGTRIRLTPSSPAKAGSVFRATRIDVTAGFDTTFEFHISDHSRVCTKHIDPTFGLEHHESCVVHGGDGLAFVLHNDPSGASAVGATGSGLGYSGIKNSLVVEFDTFTNTPTVALTTNDLYADHISIHASSDTVTAGVSTALTPSRAHELADGRIHLVRIKYVPYVDTKYLARMTATENLLASIKDNGENRRLGTLLVFVDDGIGSDLPILAVPVNLSVLLDLPEGRAYAGFTASTGEKWEKHDIINWLWCDFDNCDYPNVDATQYDYAMQSEYQEDARHNYNQPGNGFGGSSPKPRPYTGAGYDQRGSVHESMDTTPWGDNEQSRSATSYSNALSGDAANQVPPNTET